MNIIREISSALGIRSTPWVMRVYLTLLIVCLAMMLFAVAQSPTDAAESSPVGRLLSLSMDSFKIELGAVIGALSMAAQNQFGHRAGPTGAGDVGTADNSSGTP
jgi:hypothetical protein